MFFPMRNRDNRGVSHVICIIIALPFRTLSSFANGFRVEILLKLRIMKRICAKP